MNFDQIVAELDNVVNQLFLIDKDDHAAIRPLRRRIGMCLRSLNRLDPEYVKPHKRNQK